MSKVIVEYLPMLSVEIRKLISDEVSYSMISNDESSCQYEISQCLDVLESYDDVYIKEIRYIKSLISQNVSFLEF
jgi:hypothetical protein